MEILLSVFPDKGGLDWRWKLEKVIDLSFYALPWNTPRVLITKKKTSCLSVGRFVSGMITWLEFYPYVSSILIETDFEVLSSEPVWTGEDVLHCLQTKTRTFLFPQKSNNDILTYLRILATARCWSRRSNWSRNISTCYRSWTVNGKPSGIMYNRRKNSRRKSRNSKLRSVSSFITPSSDLRIMRNINISVTA